MLRIYKNETAPPEIYYVDKEIPGDLPKTITADRWVCYQNIAGQIQFFLNQQLTQMFAKKLNLEVNKVPLSVMHPPVVFDCKVAFESNKINSVNFIAKLWLSWVKPDSDRIFTTILKSNVILYPDLDWIDNYESFCQQAVDAMSSEFYKTSKQAIVNYEKNTNRD